MLYSRDYFALQLLFAQKVAAVSEGSFEDSLLFYTSFYKTFRIDEWAFDAQNVVWQDYLRSIHESDTVLEKTYAFYEGRMEQNEESHHGGFGCFSYEYEKDDGGYPYIQIHFRNADAADPGALSKARMIERMGELKNMFCAIARECPDAKTVSGFSWLYNLESYSRLFPPEYIKTRKPVTD